ncbi:LacI family DNA-binding transcriptional regulator [Paenibacillus yanchengensis]|uniref:LacI family DNA-binding transcriptional regulator n=1 Tax=Paenibacillus yanchengensis TaxID=2035833 RepID=A0ABW4YFR9_9BACL
MASIRDVAKKANISIGAVSRFLNNDPTLSISDEAKERIRRAVVALNYEKTDKTRKKRSVSSLAIITAVSPEMEIDDPYFRNIRAGIEEEAKRHKVACNRKFSLFEGIDQVEQLSSLGAIIILGNASSEAIEQIKQVNENIVLLDNYNVSIGLDTVYADFELATKESLAYLYERGHRNIAFIGGNRFEYGLDGKREVKRDDIRHVTYVNWMKQKGLEQYCSAEIGDWTPQEGMRLVEEILDGNNRPTAILVGSDPMAVGVYHGIQKRELTIGNDISILSFDDIEIARFLTPELSTSHIDTRELGRIGVRLAAERISDVRTIPIKVIIPTKLIERESVKRLDITD